MSQGNRISSVFFYYYSRIFAVFWFGGLLVATGAMLWGAYCGKVKGVDLPFIFIPVAMMVFGFFFFKKFIFDFQADVWDFGDHLLVKKSGVEDKILLSDIKNVGYSRFSPQFVTLSLRKTSKFGNEIMFLTKISPAMMIPFAKSPLVEDLIDRVDKARIGSG